MNYKIDNLQYCNWSREIFKINREAELDAVHVTIVYHEDYDELLKRVDELLFSSNKPRSKVKTIKKVIWRSNMTIFDKGALKMCFPGGFPRLISRETC